MNLIRRLPRRIHLVRHGETEGQSSIRFHGRNDVPLADAGRAQICKLAPHFDGLVIQALLTSPLARARESAALLLDTLDPFPAVVEAEEAFREIWFGRLEGMTEEEVAAAEPEWFEAFRAGDAHAYPEGDSFADFERRVVKGFEAALERHPAGELMIVAHKGVIKRILGHSLGLTPPVLREMPMDLASVTELIEDPERGEGRFQLGRVNIRG